MSHIKGISLENFRVFAEEQSIQFTPLTILTGTNNSGKSSVINGLRLLKDNFSGIKDMGELLLHRVVVDSLLSRYGNLRQFLNKKSNNNTFRISLVDSYKSIGEDVKFDVNIQVTDNDLKSGIITRVAGNTLETEEWLFDIEEYHENSRKLLKRELPGFGVMTQSTGFDAVHKVRINFSYLASKMFKENVKHEKEKREIEKKVKKRILANSPWQFLDFEAIYKTDEIFYTLVKTTLTSYYKESDLRTCLYLFQSDFVDLLTAIEWRTTEPDLLGYPDLRMPIFNSSSSKPKVNIWSDFIALFTSMNTSSVYELDILDDTYLNVREEPFYKMTFKPLIEYIGKRTKGEPPKTLELSFKAPEMEMLASDDLLKLSSYAQRCLNKLPRALGVLKNATFLSASRIETKRVYSLSGQDWFSNVNSKLAALGKNDRERAFEFISKWLKAFEIGDGIDLIYDEETTDFKPYILRGKERVLLADMGYGVSQLLPLIMSVIPEPIDDIMSVLELDAHPYEATIICIEEPESNLHPSLQSKLADMFIEATLQFNVQLIIETHSEYLIRKLQYLTAKGEILPESVNIYYFYQHEKVPPGREQVSLITINEDAQLSSDFGSGFFDEADKIALSIWNLNQSQRN